MIKEHDIRKYIGGLLFLYLSQVASADLINGSFASGLNGWMHAPNAVLWSSTGLSNDGTGSAIFPGDVLGIPASVLTQQEISLSPYNFLSFQFVVPVPTGGECDVFKALIYDDTDSALIYVWDSGDGTHKDECASGVSLNYQELGNGDALYTVQYLIDSQWKTDKVSLNFALLHDHSDAVTTLQLDNVMLTDDPVIPVPAPSAVLLVLTGIPLLRRIKKTR